MENTIVDVLPYDELKEKDKEEISERNCDCHIINDAYFYYKDELFNLSEFEPSSLSDYDGMQLYKDDKHIHAKYLADFKAQIMVQ